MKKKIEKILQFLAKKIIRKYTPQVIGITGSVGKTSGKEAIYAVVKSRFKTRRSEGNYNNEIGLPLTVIGCKAPGKSFFGWLGVVCKGLRLLFFQDSKYPEVLVLEMAADKPGDIKYLTEIAPCKVGVVTAVGSTHLELFKSVENVAKEKRVMVSHLTDTGWAVLNHDDHAVFQMQEKTRARILTFGFGEKAAVRASEMSIKSNTEARGPAERLEGVRFKINYQGNVVPVFLPGVLGKQHVYAALVGASAGLALDMNLVEISEALKGHIPPAGRMRIVPGIKHTLIVDDTYNASPVSVLAALEVFEDLPFGQKKIAALGDMLELGDFTEEGHRQVGRKVAEAGIDLLVTVGEKARDVMRAAVENGLPEEAAFNFENSVKAGRFIQARIKKGDLLLAKGSQGARMERITKELMADPLSAGTLLVRQSEKWLAR